MLWGFALAAALGPAAVRAFGSKRQSYWREAASGYSRLAYYIGASTAEVYRVILTVLHFTAVVYLMLRPYTSFGDLFWILLMYGIAIDSQSIALGNILSPEIAPLLSSVVGVFTALFNGYALVPGSFLTYPFALTQLLYSIEIGFVKHFYDATTIKDQLMYTLYSEGSDYLSIWIWIVLLRVVAFVLMIVLNRDKQR